MDANLRKNININDLLSRAKHYCAQSEQCEDTVRQKLVAWKASPDEADVVVKALQNEGYIDDVRYARAFCESKIVNYNWGRQKVLYHLRLKHLSRATVEAGMAAVSEEAYQQALMSAANGKLAELRTSGGDEFTLRKKLSAFLASKGFTQSEINQSLNNILEL